MAQFMVHDSGSECRGDLDGKGVNAEASNERAIVDMPRRQLRTQHYSYYRFYRIVIIVVITVIIIIILFFRTRISWYS